jgi:hypothetical protein
MRFESNTQIAVLLGLIFLVVWPFFGFDIGSFVGMFIGWMICTTGWVGANSFRQRREGAVANPMPALQTVRELLLVMPAVILGVTAIWAIVSSNWLLNLSLGLIASVTCDVLILFNWRFRRESLEQRGIRW